MLKRIKSLLLHNSVFIAIIITIAIAYLSLMKMPKVEVHFGNSDKLYHIIAYFSLAFFWLFTFYKKPSLKYFVIIACIIYGIIIEYLQSTITVYRTGDFRDAIANTIGILLGLIVFTQILKKIKVNS